MLIQKLDNKGRGICFIDNKITFVENALPDEDVDIDITLEKKKYNEAKVIKYNKTSSDRAIVNCPFYNECGGCDLLHLNYQKELDFKKQKVMDILKKFGSIDYNIEKIISPIEYNYRNKATFQVKENIGYYKKKSYDIISIDNCLLVDNRINSILRDLKSLNLQNIEKFIIRVGIDTMLIIKTIGKIDIDFNKIDVDTIIVDEEVVKGIGYIKEKLDNFEFIISPNSFFQVNTKGAISLYNQVLEYADLKGNENILDLYCGTGTIGIFLAKYSNQVIGIEINRSSVEDAIKNKKLNHVKNIDFICEDVSLTNLKDIDLVVVDPPRSGLDKKTINYLLNLKANKIIYVSCDPVTLARDLKELKTIYDIKDITLVNMFPKTEHVETVMILERKAL